MLMIKFDVSRSAENLVDIEEYLESEIQSFEGRDRRTS